MTEQTAERMGVPFEQFMEAASAQCRCAASASRRTSRHDRVPLPEEAGYVSGQVIYVAGGPRN